MATDAAGGGPILPQITHTISTCGYEVGFAPARRCRYGTWGPADPIDATSLANLDTMSATAARTHKPAVLDEAWLYKSANLTGGVVTDAKIGTFSFFAPLDARFLKAIVGYADSHEFAYVSPFWSGQFFPYLAWTPALAAASYGACRDPSRRVQASCISLSRRD